MEYNQDYVEIKKQIFELLDSSNKTIETKTIRINKELASLQKENHIINHKVREYIDKMEMLCYSYTPSNTLVNDVSTQLTTNDIGHCRKASNKSDGKISIQNLVINKKVHIGKHFSKLHINNISTSPTKQINYQLTEQNGYNGIMKNITNFNPQKNTSIIKMKIYSKDKRKINNIIPNTPKRFNDKGKMSPIQHYNLKAKDKDSNRTTTTMTPQNISIAKEKNIEIGLKTSKSINDVRKFSIMDIQSAVMKDKDNSIISKSNKKTMRNYLYDKNHKFFYLLAKQNIMPLKLRLIFGSKVSNFYSKQDIYSDYTNFLNTKHDELLNIKNEYKRFIPSMTSQVAFNIITSSDEQNCLNLLSHSNMITNEQLDSFYNLLIVLYYIFNEPIDDSISKNAHSLYNDLITRIIPKKTNATLKHCHLEIMDKGISISPDQLCHIEEIYCNIIKLPHFKPFDKISSALLFLLEDLHEYSLITMSNGGRMIKYNFMINYIEQQKTKLQQTHY